VICRPDAIFGTPQVGISKSRVHVILDEADLKPHQVRSWLTSLDPDFETKQAQVCGPYLKPPEGAIVVSIDEKTSIQAKQPVRPTIQAAPGRPERREFEYRRHGTVALLAALLVHSGEVKGSVYEHNSRIEFIDFLDRLEAQIPAGKQVHAILDNLQVHKTPRSASGSRPTHAGSSTSPRPTPPGSTRSSSSSRSSPAGS
jgi:DDE superfamily endonuclease